MVDAAAELSPKANVLKYLEQGADLVILSGGKEIRGPQSSGIILCKKEFVEVIDKYYELIKLPKLGEEKTSELINKVNGLRNSNSFNYIKFLNEFEKDLA